MQRRIGNTFGLSPLARGTQCHHEIDNGKNRFIPAGAGNTFVCLIPAPVSTVYPRWRGKHWDATECGPEFAGLSPLARGTLLDGVKHAELRRFIPAGAGNTSG